MKLNNFPIFKISFLLIALLFSFQNCGKVSVSAMPQVPIELASKNLPSGSYCAQTGPRFGTQVRFVFVLDMSISNLGNAAPRCGDYQSNDNRCIWRLGMGLTPAQDPYRNTETTTDKDGLRFDIIDGDGLAGKPQGFILKCGTQVDFQYSVMGFSSDIMFGGVADSCVSPFKTAQNVKQNVSALRTLQNTDKAADGTFSDPYVSPFKMGETFYSKAISCLQTKIEYDAGHSSDNPLYQVFYLTDGRPTDFLRSPCAGLTSQQCQTKYPTYFQCDSLSGDAKATCQTNFYTQFVYKPNLEDLRDYTRSKAGNLKFQPIYYGKETGEMRENAKAALNAMAEAANGEEDPNLLPSQKTQTLEIADFTTLTDQLCSKYKPQAQVAYQEQFHWAINLTSLYVDGKQEADSDMDGVIDRLDPNPLNPRSSGGVLDKLCMMKNGTTPCIQPFPDCDKQMVGLGLNACDIEVAKQIYGQTLTGFDTDGDGLPDFLEIRMGLNPTVSDLGLADRDGDGLTNYQEIQMGLNLD